MDNHQPKNRMNSDDNFDDDNGADNNFEDDDDGTVGQLQLREADLSV